MGDEVNAKGGEGKRLARAGADEKTAAGVGLGKSKAEKAARIIPAAKKVALVPHRSLNPGSGATQFHLIAQFAAYAADPRITTQARGSFISMPSSLPL
jgi:hypothetical protein